MKTNYKIAAAVLGGFALGVSAAASIQAQISAPYYGVGEITVRDENGYKNNFIPKSARADQGCWRQADCWRFQQDRSHNRSATS